MWQVRCSVKTCSRSREKPVFLVGPRSFTEPINPDGGVRRNHQGDGIPMNSARWQFVKPGTEAETIFLDSSIRQLTSGTSTTSREELPFAAAVKSTVGCRDGENAGNLIKSGYAGGL